MIINNLRFGFATNSSSSHSIILNCKESDSGYPCGEYGWDNFLISGDEVTKYFLTCLKQQIEPIIGYDGFTYLIRGFIRSVPQLANNSEILSIRKDDYVDHQSCFRFPSKFNSREINYDFLRDMIMWAQNNGVKISGGNDNDEYRYVPSGDIWRGFYPETDYFAKLDGNYWILFDKRNGTKVRFSFITDKPYEKASTPELVDIKITDYCPFGCSFCYQSSTKKGKHADKNYLWNLIRLLSECQTFEVALGGGETTSHPDFVDIIRDCKYWGIIPNFTTFTLDWLKDDNIAKCVMDDVGEFALSITSFDSFIQHQQTIKNLNKNYSQIVSKINYQLVLGVVPNDDIVKILSHEQMKWQRLTLLGYKSFGRGTKCNPIDYNVHQLLNVAENNYVRLGVDTQFIKLHEKELIEAQINKLLWSSKEGSFSMYVDAVKQKAAKDSYSTDMIDFNVSRNDSSIVKLVFSKF